MCPCVQHQRAKPIQSPESWKHRYGTHSQTCNKLIVAHSGFLGQTQFLAISGLDSNMCNKYSIKIPYLVSNTVRYHVSKLQMHNFYVTTIKSYNTTYKQRKKFFEEVYLSLLLQILFIQDKACTVKGAFALI